MQFKEMSRDAWTNWDKNCIHLSLNNTILLLKVSRVNFNLILGLLLSEFNIFETWILINK